MISIYGILISIAILICIFVAQYLDDNHDFIWKIAFWVIVAGLFGARTYHVLSEISFYAQNPIRIFFFWLGGLGIFGGILAGIATLFFIFRKDKKNLVHYLDLISVVIPLGQAIGRWGNYFNQELFGKPTYLPWGIMIPYEKRPVQYANNSFFHPLFLYESFLDLILFLFLFWSYRKNKFAKGTYTLIYLSGYSIIRFSLEFLRINPWTLFGLNVAQMISILTLIISVLILFYRNQKRKQI